MLAPLLVALTAGDARAADVLPSATLFPPLLAAMKEPRFAAAYRRTRYFDGGVPADDKGTFVDAGQLAVGGELALVGWRVAPRGFGLQLGVFGGVFSQFNLNSASTDLVNADYVAGVPVALRNGPWSLRLRGWHQSSHLGDEFLLHNPEVERVDISFEAIDGLAAGEWQGVRVYVGGGSMVRSSLQVGPFFAQTAVELRAGFFAARGLGHPRVAPVLAADWHWFQARPRWHAVSLKTGVESAGADDQRHVRVLLVVMYGQTPFGQFFTTERVADIGVEVQLEI